MPFSYYARLSRSQQAVYRKSDEIAEVRLPRPDSLHPMVEGLTRALASEDRAAVQRATEMIDVLDNCAIYSDRWKNMKAAIQRVEKV